MMKSIKILSVCLSVAALVCFASCSDDKQDAPEPLPPYKPITPTPDPGGNEDNGETFTSGMVDLDNGQICIKQDLDRGGSICYLSRSGEDRSVVNIHDEGRLIQQSYYAGNSLNRQSEGQSPNWSPWTWNPIQGGNYAGKKARIVECLRKDNTLYVKCIPMLWDMNNHEAEAVMEQWTTLEGNVAHVRCRLTCHRTDEIYGEGIARDQEIPAVYPISALTTLYAYLGNAPFTSGTLSTPTVECLQDGFWGRYDGKSNPIPQEKWMAFADANQWGLGVYSPKAERFLAGRSGFVGGEAMDASTAYIAPICTAALKKNSVMEYDYYLILDKISTMRSTIYDIHQKVNSNNQ